MYVDITERRAYYQSINREERRRTWTRPGSTIGPKGASSTSPEAVVLQVLSDHMAPQRHSLRPIARDATRLRRRRRLRKKRSAWVPSGTPNSHSLTNPDLPQSSNVRKTNHAKPTHTQPQPTPTKIFQNSNFPNPPANPKTQIFQISKMFHGTFINIYSSKTSFSDRNDQNPRV